MRLALIPMLALLAFPSHTAFAACTTAADSTLIAHGETVIDSKRGLVWQRCASGMTWNNITAQCTGQPDLMTQADAVAAAKAKGSGWRVPSGEELETLFIETCDGSKIDAKAFPNIAASDFGEGAKFWTTSEAMPGMFYYFNFTHNYADMHSSGYRLSSIFVKDK